MSPEVLLVHIIIGSYDYNFKIRVTVYALLYFSYTIYKYELTILLIY